MEFGGVALVLGEGIRREWKAERAVLLATLLGGTGASLLLLAHMVQLRMGLSDLLRKQIVSRVQDVQGVFERMGPSSMAWSSLQDFLLRSYPALLLLGILFGVILNYYLARHIDGIRSRNGERRDPFFSSWCISDWWIWGLILALSLYLCPVPYKWLGLNLLLFFLGLYLLQGIAVCSSLLQRWHLPLIVRVFVYLLSITHPFLLLLLAGLGLLDVWLNFRKV
jgi:hypothetical protein